LAIYLTVKLREFSNKSLGELREQLLDMGCDLDTVVERSLHLVNLGLKARNSGMVCNDCTETGEASSHLSEDLDASLEEE